MFKKALSTKSTLNYFYKYNFSHSLNPYVSAEEAHTFWKQNPSTTKFLDFRASKDHSQARIPNAVCVQNAFPNMQQFRNVYDCTHKLQEMAKLYEKTFQELGINQGETLIVYENPLQMTYNTQLLYFMSQFMGHNNISILNGGIDEWEYSEYETQSGASNKKLATGNFKIGDMNEQAFIDSPELQEIVQEMGQNVKIIDTRSLSEFDNGRIPQSIHIPLQNCFDINPIDGVNYKGAQEIKDILVKNNVKKDDTIIVYCNKGFRATVFFSALQNAGFSNCRNYIGSFYEWKCNAFNKHKLNKI